VALSGGEIITMADLGLPDTAFAETELQELEPVSSAQAAVPLEPVHLPPPPDSPPPAPARRATDALPSDLAAYLDTVERDILVRALERHRFNRTAAGASLGLSLRQMRYRMARLGIQVADQGLTIGEPTPEPGESTDPA
jgi:two-component system response regulator PilR (NtrC family)